MVHHISTTIIHKNPYLTGITTIVKSWRSPVKRLLLKNHQQTQWHDTSRTNNAIEYCKYLFKFKIMGELYWRGHSRGRYCLNFIFDGLHINGWVSGARNRGQWSTTAPHHPGACLDDHQYFISRPILRLSPWCTPCTTDSAHALFGAYTHLNFTMNLKFMGTWFSSLSASLLLYSFLLHDKNKT